MAVACRLPFSLSSEIINKYLRTVSPQFIGQDAAKYVHSLLEGEMEAMCNISWLAALLAAVALLGLVASSLLHQTGLLKNPYEVRHFEFSPLILVLAVHVYRVQTSNFTPPSPSRNAKSMNASPEIRSVRRSSSRAASMGLFGSERGYWLHVELSHQL